MDSEEEKLFGLPIKESDEFGKEHSKEGDLIFRSGEKGKIIFDGDVSIKGDIIYHDTVKEPIKVGRMYKESGVVSREEADEEEIEVRAPKPGMAEVGFGARMTINTGNYESVQLSVDVKLPCYVEELEDAYKAAKRFVDMKLNSEVADVRSIRKGKD